MAGGTEGNSAMLCEQQAESKVKNKNRTELEMKIEENARKFGSFIFYTALMLETLFVLLDKSNYIIQHETWLFRLTFMMFGIKILLTKYTKKEWIAIFTLGAVGIVSWMITDREEIIRIVALVAACKDIDMRKAVKVVFYETLAGILAIMLLAVSGIYGDIAVTALYRGGGIEETRYCLGMGHPNALHCMVWAVMLLFFFLYNDNCKLWEYILIFVLNIGLFLITDSRIGFIISIGTIAVFAIMRYFPPMQKYKSIYIMGMVILMLCIIFTIITGLHGEEIGVIKLINRALNGRLQIGLVEGGVSQWRLFSNVDAQKYFDMGWTRIFYWYGIIPACIYIVVICLVIWQCYRHQDYKSFLVIMLFAVYTVIEAHAVSVYIGRNYMLFIIGMYWTYILQKRS